jgi:hypothetical protein
MKQIKQIASEIPNISIVTETQIQIVSHLYIDFLERLQVYDQSISIKFLNLIVIDRFTSLPKAASSRRV